MLLKTKDGEGNGIGLAVSQIQGAVTKLKASNKYMSKLRQITKSQPQLRNQTRWSGVFTMMKTFLKIRTAMILVEANGGTDFNMDKSPEFEAKATKITAMLNHINVVTTCLQESKLSLSMGRKYLDALIRQAATKRDNADSDWYQNKFEDKYIGASSLKIPLQSRDFQSGVIKIQLGNECEMTFNEKSACKKLKRRPLCGVDGDLDEDESEQEDDFVTQMKRLQKDATAGTKRSHGQMVRQQGEYVNTDFIICSAAEVKQQWSIAGNLLLPNRAKMAPQFFEAVMMLKYNQRFWRGKTNVIADAIDLVKCERKSERAREILRQAGQAQQPQEE
jgi:hypothetical protein